MTKAAEVLAAAVAKIGGEPRPGQQVMAEAISDAITNDVHLLIQAGTGTGKSLGYLAPLLTHLAASDERAVIATATLALQHQLANFDVPTALDALEAANVSPVKWSVLKGRSNYGCLYKARRDNDGQEELFAIESDEVSETGKQVVALREWMEQEAESGGNADKDDAPPHSPLAWSQVSVSASECVGAAKCPFGAECFAERSREQARVSQLIITNHSLLAIDAELGTTLPEHHIVVIDEAHEFSDKVTNAASAQLTPKTLELLLRRALEEVDDDTAEDLKDAAGEFEIMLADQPAGRIYPTNQFVLDILTRLSLALRQAASEIKTENNLPGEQLKAALNEAFEISARMAKCGDSDVVWISESEYLGNSVQIAPLRVDHVVRDSILSERVAIFTSATLAIGGEFSAMAHSFGLFKKDQKESIADAEDEFNWVGLNVGSPFNYPGQAICYVPTDIAIPAGYGIDEEKLALIAELVWAAKGRTLGLFTSRLAAEKAAEYVRQQLPELTIWCQGDAQLSTLQHEFNTDVASCLFGTKSLWQGINVPGEACQLVIIDKLPFPRRDDPLKQARREAVEKAGGNGFMAIDLVEASLLLAQGAGRLIRSHEDRGVVAILDPRIVKRRYGNFLLSSIPNFYQMSNRDSVVQAMQRLSGS